MILSSPDPAYNRLDSRILGDGRVRLEFLGIPGFGYQLERTHSLNEPANWEALTTTSALAGPVQFTNSPSISGADFYRVRLVP